LLLQAHNFNAPRTREHYGGN